jgi:hypothetical protein
MVEVDKENIRRIMALFNNLPKKVSKDAVWGRFWKKVTVPMLESAVKKAPLLKRGTTGRVGVSYPPNPELTIARGTLKKSIKFYRTRASKGDVHGGYIGPRVKGKFKKNKGGYYGAWVEYGHKITHTGGMSEANPFMEKAFQATSSTVLANGFSDAEKIFIKAVQADARRLKKYGSLGY